MESIVGNKPIIEVLALAATVITALSFPLALWAFVREAKMRRLERDVATYSDLSAEYREFLKLCIEHTDLHIYEYKSSAAEQLSEEQKVQKIIMLDILVSLFEGAFLKYSTASTEVRKRQWTGWDSYVRDWCKREDFRVAWNTSLNMEEYDKSFLEYMDKMMEKADAEANRKSELYRHRGRSTELERN